MGRVGGDGASTGFVAYVGNKFFWAEEHANPPVPSTAKVIRVRARFSTSVSASTVAKILLHSLSQSHQELSVPNL